MVRKSLLDPKFISVINFSSAKTINYLFIFINYIIPLIVLVVLLFIMKIKYNQKINNLYYYDDN